MNWQTFLAKKPVLQQARDTLDDDTFIEFVHHLYRQPQPLGKQAFAEIGWGEGHHYCLTAPHQYILDMVGTESNRQNAIHPRLVSQQDYWKKSRMSIIDDHIALQEFFDQFVKATHGTPDTLVTTNPVIIDQVKQQPADYKKQLDAYTQLVSGMHLVIDEPIIIHDHVVTTNTPKQTLVSILRSVAKDGSPEWRKLVTECADKIDAEFE